MTKEIVWVYGASAAGKATFIDTITKQKVRALYKQFGWEDKNVLACTPSMEWVGKYIGDPIVIQRIKIPKIVMRLSIQADVILIKGQDVDLLNQLPSQLLDSLSECDHRIIYIDIGLSELMQRLPQKTAWNANDSVEDTRQWINYQLQLLNRLSVRFTVVAVDGSADASYCLKKAPSLLHKFEQ